MLVTMLFLFHVFLCSANTVAMCSGTLPCFHLLYSACVNKSSDPAVESLGQYINKKLEEAHKHAVKK